MDQILAAIIEKSSSADLVLLFLVGCMTWLVGTKRKIPRHTIELTIKMLAGITVLVILVRGAIVMF